jgi:hypothetical protein
MLIKIKTIKLDLLNRLQDNAEISRSRSDHKSPGLCNIIFTDVGYISFIEKILN